MSAFTITKADSVAAADTFLSTGLPRAVLVSPAANSNTAAPGDPIVIDLLEGLATGFILPQSLQVTVNTVIAWSGGYPQNGWAGFLVARTGGYRVTLTPPVTFAFEAEVDVQVTFSFGGKRVSKADSVTVVDSALMQHGHGPLFTDAVHANDHFVLTNARILHVGDSVVVSDARSVVKN